MTSNKKTLLFDANDILFSTQYIYLYNLNSVKDASPEFREMINIIISNSMMKGKSFYQSLMHRDVEYIIKDDEFHNFVNFADFKDMLKNSDENILLTTPYSKFMLNMSKVAIEANIKVVYENDIEKFLLTEKLKDIPSADVISLTDLKYFIDNTHMEVSDYGLYTSKTELIDRYKSKGFDIMIPNTMKFLNKYSIDRNVYPMENLWTHVQ